MASPKSSPRHGPRPAGASPLFALPGYLVLLVLGVACSEDSRPTGATALFDPNLDQGFLSLPWPGDARLTEDGAPDLTTFPNPGGVGLIETYRDAVLQLVRGAGAYPLMQVRFDGDLDPDAWPAPSDTLAPDSPVILLNVDPDSPGYLQRLPVQLHWQDDDRVYVDARTLSAYPAIGFPLLPATTYAFVIVDSLGDADGLPLGIPQTLQSAIDGVGHEQLAAATAPLGDALDAVGVPRSSVAAATVFTTQETTAELHQMRDWLMEPTHVEAPVIESVLWVNSEFTTLNLWELTYSTPIFQAGEPPYATSGGGFEFIDGEPVIQRWETVTASLSIPTTGNSPYPIVIALPGTGGSIYDHLDPQEPYPMGRLLAERGIATLSIEPPLTGGRGEGAMPDLHTFNYFNPESARCVLRQEALDASYAIRLIREELPSADQNWTLDASRLGFFGHSQGAHTGALLAAVEPELDPVMINGMGGVLAYTIIERKTPFDIEETVRLAIGETSEPMTIFHPMVGIAQLLVDVVDPIHYGPEWYLQAPHNSGTSVLHTAGYLDPFVPYQTINGLAVASGNHLVWPAQWEFPEMELAGLESLAPPYSANVVSAYGEAHTVGLITRADTGHWTVQDSGTVAIQAAEFLESGLSFGGDPPVVLPPGES